jgi:uncharacterized membrane protein
MDDWGGHRLPWLLVVLGATLVGVGLLTQVEGFRQTLSLHPLRHYSKALKRSALEWCVRRWPWCCCGASPFATPLSEVLGKVVFEAVPFALGVALARSTLQGKQGRDRRTTTPLSRRLVSPTLSTCAMPWSISTPP